MKKTSLKTLDYLDGKQKLTKTEYEYMKIVWSNPEGVSSEDIYKNFSQAPGTKGVILHKIAEKGYVSSVQKGRHHWYYPVISQKEYEQALMKQELKKNMGYDSFGDIIAAFCGKKSLTNEQLDKIEKFIEELEDEDSNQ